MAEQHRIQITTDGQALFVHSDELEELLSSQGAKTTVRASFVEPDNQTGKWTVDLSPIGMDALSFLPTRREALNHERGMLDTEYGRECIQQLFQQRKAVTSC